MFAVRCLAGLAGAGVMTTLASAGSGLAVPAQSNQPIETLSATGGLPAHIALSFEDPVGFVQAKSGEFIVLDRRAHTVYAVNAKKTAVRKVLQVGSEQGNVMQPAALAINAEDVFVIADSPTAYDRIQFFSPKGTYLGGFLQTKDATRLVVGPLIVNGVGSMAFTGKTILLNRPEAGALFSEFEMAGAVARHVGTLRPTGQEADRAVHAALNIGLPLVDPTGGFYFVFQTGRPMFRKYDASGALLFERHIEGPELDQSILNLPTMWPRRAEAGGTVPLVLPLVRTAAVDPTGRLWVSLMAPTTYVYDARGEKVRTIQFRAAGIISPGSFFFTSDGRMLVTPGCYEFTVRPRSSVPGPRPSADR